MGECRFEPHRRLVAPLSLLLLSLSLASATLYYTVPGSTEPTACHAVWSGATPFATKSGINVLVPSITFANSEISPTVKSWSGLVVVRDPNWRTVYIIDEIAKFKENNATAAVIGTFYAEPGRAVWPIRERVSNRPDLSALRDFPVFQVTNANCSDLFTAIKALKENETITGYITDEDLTNPFERLSAFPNSLLIQLAFFLPPVVGIALALFRLVPRIMYHGFQLKLPYIVLSLELLSHTLRVVFAVDPEGMVGLYDPFNSIFWFTPNVAVSLICHFVVLFYWNRAMKSFGTKPLEWAIKYVYILAAAIVIVEVVSATLRSIDLAYETLYLAQVFYVILMIGVIIYILYTSVGIFKYLRENKLNKRQERAKGKVLRMVNLLMVSATLLILLVLLSGFALTPFFRMAIPELVFWLVQFTCVSTIAIIETLVMKPVSRPGQSSKTTEVTLGKTKQQGTGSSTLSGSLSSPEVTPRINSPSKVDDNTSAVEQTASNPSSPSVGSERQGDSSASSGPH